MAKAKATNSPNTSNRRRPALNPEAREQQMISYAVDLAEQQLRDGTASSQVITHYLKLGTMNAQLEREKLKMDNELTKAKIEALQSQKNMEETYMKAINAMRNYAGYGDADDY